MSSKTFPSTGEKPKFDPNAAYEAVQDTPVPKGNKPAFNPNKKFEVVQEVEEQKQAPEKSVQSQPAFQLSEPTLRAIPKESAVAPSAPNEKINIQRSEVEYIPDEKSYKIQQQQGKAKIAHEKVNAALLSNDAQYEKKIKEYRKDNYTIESLRNEYKQNGQILSPQDEQKVLQINKQREYSRPVTNEDITDFKTGTITTPKLSRKFIKDLNDKDVAESAYQVDKFNEIANDPDPNAHNRIEKINEVAKGIKKGTYVYDPETKTVVQPLGLIGSMMEGVKNKFKGDEEHDFLKNTTNNSAIISQLEDERNNPDRDEPIKVPRGKVGEVLKSVAEMPMLPMVAGVAGTIGGTFVGNPELGTVAATALGAYENRKAQYRATFKQVYNEARDQGKPEFDALTEARRQAENAQEIGTVVGAAQGYLGGKIGEIPVKGTSFNLGYQQAIGDFLKKNGSDLGKIVLDAAAQGGLGAAGEITKNKLAQAAGIKRDWDEGTESAFWGNALMTAGIGAAIKLGRGISKVNYKTILSGLTKTVPEEAINSTLQEKVSTGEITQAAADQALNEINEYKAKDAQIPANVTEEARFKIQDNIDKINELQGQKEATHESLQGPIKEKIQKLIEDNLALAKETVKEEKPVSGLEKSKEKEAIDFAHELVDEGILPDTYSAEVKKDPIKFWQTVAQQAQNRDENWKPLSHPLDEQAVRDDYGDTIVDYAKELFPAPEIYEPSKSISVIQPGEIKQPEAITIAPKEPTEKIGHVEVSEHGEDTKTAAGQENGVKPSKLTEAGRKEAEELGQYLVDNNKKKIIVSEVERAQETANVAAQKADVPIETNPILNTWDIGHYDGKPEGSFVEEAWVNKRNEAPKGGESFNDFTKRMEQAYEYVKSLPEDNHVITHSKVMRALDALSKTDGKWTEETTKEFLNNKELTHAVPIEKSDAMDVRQQTTDGEGVGAGNIQPEGASGEETAIPKEENPSESKEGQPIGIHAEQPPTVLSYRGLQEVANEFGYEDVKPRDRVSDIQEKKNAEQTANEWAANGEYQKNIDDMLSKIADKEMVPTAKQRLILQDYLANERQALRDIKNKLTPEYDRQLAKVERIKEIGQIARAEAGAALRLPDGGSLPHPILDEVAAMTAKKEANAVDTLTDAQKEEVLKQVEGYKKASDEANTKVAALEDQVAKLKAAKELKKVVAGVKNAKKTVEERVAYRKSEIEAAREALRKLRTGESGLSTVPLPGVRELMAIAPHVKNIMVDLVAQGVTELNDIVKNIHNEFKEIIDGITEKDIHNIIAGEYNEKKRPLSELQQTVRDLKYEAHLINKLEALENGLLPKNEKALRERNQKIKALKDQISELLRQHEKEEPDYGKRLKAIKKRNENKIKQIEEKIKNGDFEKAEKEVSIFDREDVKKQFPKLRKEALDAIAKREDKQHEYDVALLNDEMKRMTKKEKVADFGGKLLHTFKSLMAGIDDSATFVQNGLVMLANPKLGAKAWLEHWKDAVGTNWKEAFSDKRFKRELAALHNSADWDIIKNSGVDIEEPQSPTAEKVSEMFEKNLLAKKFKVDGKEYQPWQYTGGVFERAFTSMGNNMRVLLFRKRMLQLLREGKTFESHPDEYKAAARVVNELTGRGKQNKYLELANPVVSPIIWAPKMLASTINTLGLSDLAVGIVGKKIGAKMGTEGYYRSLTPAQRKFALMQLGQGVGVGVAIMGAAALGGAKVDSDPYSVTFGDIIAGDHHYNVFGRFAPVVKTIVQMASGRRDSKSGVNDLDKPKYGGKTRLSVLGGFVRGKVTPAVGTAMNLIEGKDYFTQKPFGLKDVPASLIQPMSIKDLKDGWNNDGTMSLLNRFLPAFEGVKTTDERDFQKQSESNTGGGAGATGRYSKQKKSKANKPHKTHR